MDDARQNALTVAHERRTKEIERQYDVRIEGLRNEKKIRLKALDDQFQRQLAAEISSKETLVKGGFSNDRDEFIN